MQTEETESNGNEEGADCGDGWEDVRVVLDDALHRTEGVERKAVLLWICGGDEQDDADVLEQEDGGGNSMVRTE